MIAATEAPQIVYRNAKGLPPTICIQLLKWCNLKCQNCRSDSTPFDKENLSFEQISPVLIGLGKYGKWRISLTGGEPLFWAELPRMLALIDELDFPFSVTTNGFSSQGPFNKIPSQLWRNGTLYVSLDGNEPIHDHLRGSKSFENAIEFLMYARQHVSKLYVNTVLFTDPVLWAEELYSVINNIGVNNWTIISPVSVGRWSFGNGKATDVDIYNLWYKQIQETVINVKGSTTTSFLDFAHTEGVQDDVVFIDANGNVALPRFYKTEVDSNIPAVQKLSINDKLLVEKIYSSVNNFIESQNYIR